MAVFSRWTKDHWGGALLVATGAAVSVAALGYRAGTLRQMGSGFFPLVLGVVLALAGVAQCLATPLARPGTGAQDETPPLGSEHAHLAGPVVQWRGWLCVVGGVAAFVVLGAHGGLVPASFASVFVAALGDRRNSVRDAALLAVVMTAFGVAVFHYGLRVLLPLFEF